MWKPPLGSALIASSLPCMSTTRMATPLTGELLSASSAMPLMLPSLRVGFERAIDVEVRSVRPPIPRAPEAAEQVVRQAERPVRPGGAPGAPGAAGARPAAAVARSVHDRGALRVFVAVGLHRQRVRSGIDIGRNEATVGARDEPGQIATIETNDGVGDGLGLVLLVDEAADEARGEGRGADQALDDLRLGRRRLHRVERESGAEPQIPLRRGSHLFDERRRAARADVERGHAPGTP